MGASSLWRSRDCRRPWKGRAYCQVMVSAPGRVGAEAAPVPLKLAAELRDPGLAQAELAGHVLGALAVHQVVDHPAVALAPRGPPGREVKAEADLLGHGRDRVLPQGLLQRA